MLYIESSGILGFEYAGTDCRLHGSIQVWLVIRLGPAFEAFRVTRAQERNPNSHN